MDVGTISIVLVLGLVFLLAIGMPLGFASAVLALVVMIMKFEPGLLLNPLTFGEGLLTGSPGTGPLYILTQKIFDLLTEYVLISVPLFIFMAALLERSGVAKDMYDALDFWLSRLRGGIAIVTSLMAVLLAAEGREAELARKVMAGYIAYSFERVGEVCESISDIDTIMGSGFNWAPPCVLVDLMGAPAAASMIEGAGLAVPDAIANAGDGTRFFNDPTTNRGRFFVAA